MDCTKEEEKRKEAFPVVCYSSFVTWHARFSPFFYFFSAWWHQRELLHCISLLENAQTKARKTINWAIDLSTRPPFCFEGQQQQQLQKDRPNSLHWFLPGGRLLVRSLLILVSPQIISGRIRSLFSLSLSLAFWEAMNIGIFLVLPSLCRKLKCCPEIPPKTHFHM